MEASEMLDVIHVFFEEDMLPGWEQEVEVKSQMRQTLYRTLYGEEYKYGYGSEHGRAAEFTGHDGPSLYDEPIPGKVKPYFPPSSEQELSAIVGPALGE